jgi:hypothetical protein
MHIALLLSFSDQRGQRRDNTTVLSGLTDGINLIRR